MSRSLAPFWHFYTYPGEDYPHCKWASQHLELISLHTHTHTSAHARAHHPITARALYSSRCKRLVCFVDGAADNDDKVLRQPPFHRPASCWRRLSPLHHCFTFTAATGWWLPIYQPQRDETVDAPRIDHWFPDCEPAKQKFPAKGSNEKIISNRTKSKSLIVFNSSTRQKSKVCVFVHDWSINQLFVCHSTIGSDWDGSEMNPLGQT